MHARHFGIGLGLRLVGALLLGHALLLYVPVSTTALAGVAAVTGLAMLLSPASLLPLAVSFALTTAALEVVVRIGLLTPYYRPHEQLALDTTYRPGQRVVMDVPHGDLLAIDPTLDRSLATPRHEVFVTDSAGHRNERDYHGQRLVLVGDSFLVGTESTLADLLRRERGIAAYNLSFSSIGPLIYTDKLRWARRNLDPEACLALFFFEGNDFQPVDRAELERRRAVSRDVQLAVKSYVHGVRDSSEWSKTFYGLATRAAEAFRSAAAPGEATPPPTFVDRVAGRPIAFLRGYADVVRRQTFDDYGFIRDQLAYERPDLVYFIPDKFRVYSGLLEQHPQTSLAHAQWAYLEQAASSLGIPAVDLTPPLVDRSLQLAASGEMTFWPDDTHWNRHGEAVAADVLLATLARSPRCAPIAAPHTSVGVGAQ